MASPRDSTAHDEIAESESVARRESYAANEDPAEPVRRTSSVVEEKATVAHTEEYDGSQTPPAPEDEVVLEEESLPTTVEELQALVVELRKENAELKKQIEDAASSQVAGKKKLIPDVAPTGKLQHITRGRIAPRAKASKPAPETESPSAEPSIDGPPSSSSEVTTTEVDPAQAEEARKKRIIMNMGGVNPLMGFDPSSVVLKQRSMLHRGLSASSSGTVSPQSEPATTASPVTLSTSDKPAAERVSTTHDFVLPEANEGEVRAWIVEVVGDTASNVKDGEIRDALKDGQVLVKLINGIKPDANLKVNTGRFTFMHLENINNFLKSAEHIGVPRSALFSPPDLVEGSDTPKVVNVLGYLKTLVEKR